ncbi:MAG: hypothetical protein OEZ39_00640 [Gammaproteobacteria bacterium]|nr:hypothetical protein [Gammaproteobacteria bacterium]
MGHTLRETENSSMTVRTLGIIFGVPQALFGLVSFSTGLSIIIWVLYNTFIKTTPQYSGGILEFGITPGLLLMGIYWLRHAFDREKLEDNNEGNEQE